MYTYERLRETLQLALGTLAPCSNSITATGMAASLSDTIYIRLATPPESVDVAEGLRDHSGGGRPEAERPGIAHRQGDEARGAGGPGAVLWRRAACGLASAL